MGDGAGADHAVPPVGPLSTSLSLLVILSCSLNRGVRLSLVTCLTLSLACGATLGAALRNVFVPLLQFSLVSLARGATLGATVPVTVVAY